MSEPGIARLSAARRALLDPRLRSLTAGDGPVPRPGGSDVAPLCSSQERVWILEELAGDRSPWLIPVLVRLTGRLDAPALRAALDEVVARHEALRTCFPVRDGRPVQLVLPPAPLALAVEDLTGLSRTERELRATRAAVAVAEERFALADGPGLRVRLLRVADEEHLLLLCLHHIVADAWSVGLVMRELSVLYADLRRGRPASLPAPGLQSADVAVWERGRQAALADRLTHWRDRLTGAPGVLPLRLDRPAPAEMTYGGARYRFHVPAALTRRLEALASGARATPFMALLTAYAALLHAHSGQDDLLVGLPASGRVAPELLDVVGCFVNTLVVRSRLTPGTTFLDLLERIREACVEGREHEVPFDVLVNELRPERRDGRPPLVQAMCNFIDAPEDLFALDGLEVGWLPVPMRIGRTDLWLDLEPGGGGVRAELEYRTDLFAPSSAAALARLYLRLLEAMADAPDAEVARHPVVAAERSAPGARAGEDTGQALDRIWRGLLAGAPGMDADDLLRDGARLADLLRTVRQSLGVDLPERRLRTDAAVIGLRAALEAAVRSAERGRRAGREGSAAPGNAGRQARPPSTATTRSSPQ